MKYPPQKLYSASAKSLEYWEKIRRPIVDLLKFWTLRYKVLVDNAPRKFDCPKNQQVYRFWTQDQEYPALIEHLKKIRNDIDEFIQMLEAEQVALENYTDDEEGY